MDKLPADLGELAQVAREEPRGNTAVRVVGLAMLFTQEVLLDLRPGKAKVRGGGRGRGMERIRDGNV